MIYANLISGDMGKAVAATVAVLPLAAIEQHGDHLPVVTDTAIVSEIACRVEATLPERVVLLPTLWAGCSHHHRGFPGTLSLGSETYVRVLCDLVESLIGSGFRRIFLLNGHGGNQTPFAEALYRLGLSHPGIWVAAQSYWKLAARELAAQKFMETPTLSHACEYETSMMLALCGERVRMDRARGTSRERASAFYDPLDYTPSRVVVSETFERLTTHGAMGSPEKATREKGQRLFDLIVPVVVEFVSEFSDWPISKPDGAANSTV